MLNSRIIVSLLVLLLLSACSTTPTSPSAPMTRSISGQVLQDEYGLDVFLLGVTAAGGLVDLRVKIVDAEKAATLLQNAEDYPLLQTANGTILYPAAEPPVGAELEDGAILFAMFSNPDDGIAPGDPVRVLFGDVALDDVIAQ